MFAIQKETIDHTKKSRYSFQGDLQGAGLDSLRCLIVKDPPRWAVFFFSLCVTEEIDEQSYFLTEFLIWVFTAASEGKLQDHALELCSYHSLTQGHPWNSWELHV